MKIFTKKSLFEHDDRIRREMWREQEIRDMHEEVARLRQEVINLKRELKKPLSTIEAKYVTSSVPTDGPCDM